MKTYVGGGSHICRYCEVELIPSENIRPSAVSRYDWVCNDCRKRFRKDNKKRNLITIEELERQLKEDE